MKLIALENILWHRHFSDRQCVEVVAAISLFGFLNRWNGTMATTLEDAPRSIASRELANSGWTVSKHGSD